MRSSREEDTMMIRIGAMTGRQFSIEALPSDTLMDVKLKIYKESDLPPESQILVYKDRKLTNDNATLSQHEIQDGASLSLVLEMNGGKNIIFVDKFKGHGPSSTLKVPKNQSIEADMQVLEKILKALDGDTAFKLLNLLEEKPEILDILFPEEDASTPRSALSSARSSLDGTRSTANSQEGIEEEIGFGDINCNVSSDSSRTDSRGIMMFLDNNAVTRSTPNFKRPTSTQSIQFSFHTRTSSISSLELVQLLRKSESVQKIVSRASSGASVRKLKFCSQSLVDQIDDRPSTTMAVLDKVRDELSLTIVKSRPATTKKSGIPILRRTSSKNVVLVNHKTHQSSIEERSASSACRSIPNKSAQKSAKLLRSKFSSTSLKKSLAVDTHTASKQKSSQIETCTSSSTSKEKCEKCNKKLGLISMFKCKCGKKFCSTHRYSDRHSCSYNYKEAGKAQLIKNNPLVQKGKVSKI